MQMLEIIQHNFHTHTHRNIQAKEIKDAIKELSRAKRRKMIGGVCNMHTHKAEIRKLLIFISKLEH